MRLRALLAALTALAAFGFAAPASAAGEACYDVDVVVNGDAVVDEADCVALP